ncbi:MAG: hypothetical protein ACPG32_05935 [Akkermansiaceae bacterium]
MNVKQLAESAANGGNPPAGLNDALRSLWLARAGRWDDAHDLCQEVDGYAGAWIHAHLHRVEGDLANAGYWYSQAKKNQPDGQAGLGEEWMQIATELMELK